jgi:phosphatidylglycerophosphate synthase
MRVARKDRTGYELLCEAVYRPLAQLLVPPLARLRVPPPAVVVANAACAVAAAVALLRGNLVAAALLLQAKTLLDNADGQLARSTGRITALGRYLDSLSDLATNAVVVLALGWHVGHPWLGLGSYLALTAVLSVNFNLERLARGAASGPADGGVYRRIYGLVYAPQDRLAERLFAGPRGRGQLTFVAQFGLSTQWAALGLCLVAGRPELYLFVPFACLAALVPLVRRPATAPVPEAS